MVATVQAAKQVKMKHPPENSSACAARTGRGHYEVGARRERACSAAWARPTDNLRSANGIGGGVLRLAGAAQFGPAAHRRPTISASVSAPCPRVFSRPAAPDGSPEQTDSSRRVHPRRVPRRSNCHQPQAGSAGGPIISGAHAWRFAAARNLAGAECGREGPNSIVRSRAFYRRGAAQPIK
jgi:hypothetical protein